MNAQQILKAMGREKCTSHVRNQTNQLASIFNLVKELKKIGIVKASVEPCEFQLGKETRRSVYSTNTIEGEKMPGERFVVETSFGRYSQVLPQGLVSLSFRSLLTDYLPKLEAVEKPKPDFALSFDEKQTAIIKSALKFASNDTLRPAWMNVRIEVKEFGLVNVVATDGNRLYFEQFFNPLLTEQVNFLLPVKELKSAKGKTLEVELFKNEGDEITNGSINGDSFVHCNERYPDYMAVWPDYQNYIELHREDLIQAVKTVLPFANKTTHQLRFYFNGCVEIKAEDLDFCNESKLKVDYRKKTTEDFEIGFNGKYLLEALQLSKETTLRIYSQGKPNKAVIIDNNSLLMPVMLDQYI